MRTNIDLNDKLMKQALSLSGLTTKKAVVEASLKLLVQIENQKKIRKYFGLLQWTGNLKAMRTDA